MPIEEMNRLPAERSAEPSPADPSPDDLDSPEVAREALEHEGDPQWHREIA